MYRFIALLLISALLLTGCAKAETDSYIRVIVPEGGGYEAAVTPKPMASAPTASPPLTPSEAPEAPFTPQPTALPIQTAKPVPSLTAAPTAAPTVILTASDDDYNLGILELVNQYRQQAGMNTLKYSSKLQKAADTRPRDRNPFRSHPAKWRQLLHRRHRRRYKLQRIWRKHIYVQRVSNVTSKLIFDAWMDSPSHRKTFSGKALRICV